MKLIFIHGSGGCKESWELQTRHFKNSLAINLPGHPNGELCSTISEYTAWLHTYIQDNKYHDVVLVGHSLGGAIALQYALDYPKNLMGIITAGSGGRLRVHPDVLKMLEKALKEPMLINKFTATAYDLIEHNLAEKIRKRDAENAPIALFNDLKACDEFDVMDRLGDITIPVLAIVGDQDVMTPPKYSDFLVDKITNAKTVVIPKGTHFAYAEQPKRFNQIVDTFVQGLIT